MPTRDVFQRILVRGAKEGKLPGMTQESKNWFRTKARKESSGQRTKLQSNSARTTSRIEIGQMYFFAYDAKTKDKLPFWDAFPLIFPIGETSEHFIGLNLHYLPPQLRAKLMDSLYGIMTDKRYDEKTRLAISYDILNASSRFKLFQPCLKKYLKSNVRSKFIKVSSYEWDIALMLPVADWRKSSSQKVFANSRSKLK